MHCHCFSYASDDSTNLFKVLREFQTDGNFRGHTLENVTENLENHLLNMAKGKSLAYEDLCPISDTP
jgi:hypothetical protein